MDLALFLKNTRSKSEVDACIDWIGSNEERLSLLVDIVAGRSSEEQRKGAWVLTTLCESDPDRITPYLKKVIGTIDSDGLHQGVYRSLIRVLQHCEIPKNLHGRVTNSMFRILGDPKRSIAEYAFSIDVACSMVLLYPELRGEFELLIEQISKDRSSAGVHSSIRRAHHRMKKIT